MSESDLEKMGHHRKRYRKEEVEAISKLSEIFEKSPLPTSLKIQSFPRHVRRQDIARFLTKYEIYKKVINLHGSIAECGVFVGGGLFTWYHLVSILEPYNHTCKVIGFDTFEGFENIGCLDTEGQSEHLRKGAFATHPSICQEIMALADAHDMNRPLGHIPRLEIVKGDACKTIPSYIESNPHLLLKLLYLDFDLYEPTLIALTYLMPKVVRGGVVAFDQLNCPDFPGETIAFLHELQANVRLERLGMDPWISWFIKE